jgi:precorrin-6x reductase
MSDLFHYEDGERIIEAARRLGLNVTMADRPGESVVRMFEEMVRRIMLLEERTGNFQPSDQREEN